MTVCDDLNKNKQRIDKITLILSSLFGGIGLIVLIVALGLRIKQKPYVCHITILGLVMLLLANIAAWALHSKSMKYQKDIYETSCAAPTASDADTIAPPQ